jgi:dienelactone hydrolase
MDDCCTRGFLWNGTPSGKEGRLADRDAYISGDSPDRAIMIMHDAFGWTLNNTRLLADIYAKRVGATVYLPDFYHGWAITDNDATIKEDGNEVKIEFKEHFDSAKWFATNGPDVRLPEVVACGRELREKYSFVGAVGKIM